MGEQPVVGVAVVGHGGVEAGLVELRHEFTHGQRHGVAQHERADKRQHRVAQDGIAGADAGQLGHRLLSGNRHDGVHQDQQHDDGGDDAGHPAHELLAAQGEQVHESRS